LWQTYAVQCSWKVLALLRMANHHLKKGCGLWNDGTREERKSEIFSPSGGGEKFFSESLLHAHPTETLSKGDN